MKRRNFLKISFLTIPSIYLFPDKLFGNEGGQELKPSRSGNQELDLPPAYSGEIIEGNILIPKELLSYMVAKKIYLVAPEKESVLVIISGNDPQQKLLKDVERFNRIIKDDPFCHVENTEIASNGKVVIPEKIKTITGMKTGEVAIIRLDEKEFIESYESGFFKDQRDAGFSLDVEYYVNNLTFFVVGQLRP